MISKLKKNLTVLLSALFCVVFLGGIGMFNWGRYEDRLMELRKQVRIEVSDIGLKQIEKTRGAAFEMDAVDYAIFRVKKDGSVELYSNHLPGVDETKQYAYARKVAEHWKQPVEFLEVTSITKQGRPGRYVVLISVYPAVQAMVPTLIASVLIAGLGIVLLILLTRLLSQRLVRPVEQMLASEKKFMSNASHELKTPLAVISANTQLLEEEIGENRHLQYIRQETGQMIAMVNKMLTLMRLDTPVAQTNQSRFCVDEALLDVIYPMESVAYEKKLNLNIDIQEQMYMTGDEDQMKNLIAILLDNAISYTPPLGTITIHAALRARKLSLFVANTGEPIPKEQQEKLFERFYRADEARENSGSHFGLGLSIAGRIVANNHGKIWVESHDGQNMFQVVLPAGK